MAALFAGSAVIAVPLHAPAFAAAGKAKATKAEVPQVTAPQASKVKSGAAGANDASAADLEAIAAKRDPHYTSATGTATDEGCLRQRKRLWIEGEGWMVRKVTVCP